MPYLNGRNPERCELDLPGDLLTASDVLLVPSALQAPEGALLSFDVSPLQSGREKKSSFTHLRKIRAPSSRKSHSNSTLEWSERIHRKHSLQERSRKEWGDKVKVLFGDMRTVPVPEQVDILVSELLGSFGDNELSPECLDGAMRFLKGNYRTSSIHPVCSTLHESSSAVVADGISIPASYTAYLAPLSSSKLYNETRESKQAKAVETPYVVMFQAVNILSGDGGGIRGVCGPRVQECWEFEHPRRDAVLNEQGKLSCQISGKRSIYLPSKGFLLLIATILGPLG